MKNRFIIIYTTILAFSALYAPQPILPLLSAEFAVGPSQASLLITATLLPLGLAPVVYGFILESIPAKTLLRSAVLLLALSELPFLFVDSFWVLVATRLFQGLLLPAIFTSLMTYLSTMTESERIKQVMSIYIAATIFGGFSGRAVSGLIGGYSDWRYTFLLLSIGLGIAYILLFFLDVDARARFARLRGGAIAAVVGNRVFLKAYLIIFLVFFIFASLLNLLPFRLTELSDTVSGTLLATVYIGYLIGIVIALSSIAITHRCGGEVPTILLGLSVYALGIVLFALPNIPMIFATMWVFCAGMFLVHSVLSGYLNHQATEYKGVVNGLYISFYYAGGTLGSFLPGYIYRDLGWGSYIICLFVLVSIALAIGVNLRRSV